MDQFLTNHGTHGPFIKGTTDSINKGKIVVDDKLHQFINGFWTSYGRVMFCSLDKPSAYKPNASAEPGRLMYTVRLLLNPAGCAEWGEAANVLVAAAQNDSKARTKFQPLGAKSVMDRFGLHVSQGGLNWPLQNGDLRYQQDPIKFADYQGMRYVNLGMYPATTAGVAQKPIIMDRGGQLCDPNVIYPGCYATAQITLSWYANDFSAGIKTQLSSIMFAYDGVRIANNFDNVQNAQHAAQSMAEPDFGPAPGTQPIQQPGFAMPQQQPAQIQYPVQQQQVQHPAPVAQPQQTSNPGMPWLPGQ